MKRPAFLPDNFTLLLVATVALATLLPARGVVARFFDDFTTFAIGLLFFLHGAKLSRDAIRAGITHWRLHLLVFACTFVMFPLLGLALKPLLQALVTRELYTGVLFLCVLPATVQSAIAFTSIARGNMPAAVCSASASTMLGVFVTPLLVDLVVLPHAAGSTNEFDAIVRILLQLMLPFVAGHLLRPWISGWLHRRKQVLGLRRPRLHPAGRLHGLQRGRHRGPVEAGAAAGARRPAGGVRGAAGLRAGADRLARAPARASTRPTRSRSCSAARRRAWPAASRWPRCCSPRSRSAPSCCR